MLRGDICGVGIFGVGFNNFWIGVDGGVFRRFCLEGWFKVDFEVEDVFGLVVLVELEGMFWEEGIVCVDDLIWWLVEELVVWLEEDFLLEDCCIINYCWWM